MNDTHLFDDFTPEQNELLGLVHRVVDTDPADAAEHLNDAMFWDTVSLTCAEVEAILTLMHAHGVDIAALVYFARLHAGSDDSDTDLHAHLARPGTDAAQAIEEARDA